MKLYIPELTTQIQLSKPWKFPLYKESRNETLLDELLPDGYKQYKEKADKLRIKYNGAYSKIKTIRKSKPFSNGCTIIHETTVQDSNWEAYQKFAAQQRELESKERGKFYSVTIPAGTLLEVDRIYIRKGANDFSSVTFKWVKGEGKNKKTLRFWAKLEDINNIECELAGKNIRWPNGKFTLARWSPYSYKGGEKAVNRIYYEISFNKDGHGWIGVRDETEGKRIESARSWRSSPGNDYDSLDKMLAAAKRQEFPEALVNEFLKKYREKYES